MTTSTVTASDTTASDTSASDATETFTFPKQLNLDRQEGIYTFTEIPDTVRVVNADEEVSLDELALLFHPYEPRNVSNPLEMFDREVLADIEVQKRRRAAELARQSREQADSESASSDEPPVEEDRRVPVTAGGRTLARIDPGPLPMEKAQDVQDDSYNVISGRLESPQGSESVIQGGRDEEIRETLVQVCQDVDPKHLLLGQSLSEGASQAEQTRDGALVSQAFGNHLKFEEADLFGLAKSAVMHSVSRTGYTQINKIKEHLLLNGPSASLEKKVSQYYRDVVYFLAMKNGDEESAELIKDSKYIYMNSSPGYLDDRALALGISDAFLVLKYAGKMTIEILPERLREILPLRKRDAVASADQLLREACYNEFRQSIDTSLSGGDHCDFFPLGRDRRGIIIFDVSGHEERASRIRDELVEVFDNIQDRTNPARVMEKLNQYALEYPFPQDLFVSAVYGVLDGLAHTFEYANAGDHPPDLARGDQLLELKDTNGMALNIFDVPYTTEKIDLRPMDCLIFYTDGLLEAVQDTVEDPEASADAPNKEFFGKDRLEEALTRRQVHKRRASEAVDLILAAAQDQGFTIEDDITIQVYRHV